MHWGELGLFAICFLLRFAFGFCSRSLTAIITPEVTGAAAAASAVPGPSGAASASIWDSATKLRMDFNAWDALADETDVPSQIKLNSRC